MKSLKLKLLSTTTIPVLVGAGIAIGGTFMLGGQGYALNLQASHAKQLPIAKSRPGGVRLAACNPCAAKNPCNPCAAKNPCNPCAAKNPCNPCAAKNPCNPCAGAATAGSSKCVIPRLMTAALKNPCEESLRGEEPVQPLRGEEPVQPLRGEEPVQPLRGEEPMQPLRGEEPVQPLRGEEPMQPLRGEEPV